MVVLGGAKPSDKLAVIANLLDNADRLLIGGGMSYTFLKAEGHEVGKSLLEEDRLDDVALPRRPARGRAGAPGRPGRGDGFRARRRARDVPGHRLPGGPGGLDMGPATRALFAEKLADAKTVFWNGPVGVFEFPAFSQGTRAVAEAISSWPG